MSQTLQESKARLDRALMTKIVGQTEALEKAILIGLRQEMITDPASRRTLDAVLRFYEEEGRTSPSQSYLEQRGIPYHPLHSPDTVEQLVPQVREAAVSLRLHSLMSNIPRLVAGGPAIAAGRVYDQAMEIAELSKAKKPELSKMDIANQIIAERIAAESDSGAGIIPYAGSYLTALTKGRRGLPSYTVIFGKVKSYKSTRLIFDAYTLAADLGYKVCIASGELSKADLMSMMASFRAKVSLDAIRSLTDTEEDRMKYFQALEEIAKMDNLLIADKPKRGIMELDLYAKRAARFNAELVYLDGAHRLPESQDYKDVTNYAQRVYEHCTETIPVPWTVAVQSNRELAKLEAAGTVKKEKGRKVTSAMLDIAGSKAWLEECTAALRCVKTGFGSARVEVTETRYGQEGAVDVNCQLGFNMEEIGPSVDDVED